MITSHERFRMQEDGGPEWFLEVNWDTKDEKTNASKVVKVTFPDGKSAFVKKEHLLSVLFAIGNESEQMRMVPETLKRVRWYETTLSVTAKKDIKKGEELVFPVKLSLPPVEEEVIGKTGEKSPLFVG